MALEQHRKKVKHYNVPGDAHFLTFSCYQRLPLLSKDRTRLWLLEAVCDARTKHAFDLWAWVIMPEHVHLLLWPRFKGYRMEKILASIKRPVGWKAIQYLKRERSAFLKQLSVRHRNRDYYHFWQVGPGRDHNLYETKAIHAAIDYIHMNPVRRGLVARPEEWPWSSARDWAGMDVLAPIRVDRTVPDLLVITR